MANQFLKLRRSSVPGKIPDTASLDFGEIALNTFDGRAFMKKSSSLGEEVIIIGSTQGAFTGSFSGSFTGSLFGTASWAYNALTASTADDFVIRGTLTGSNALFTGTVTAQTLVVQTISSSVIYSSGSNTFGDELTDKQTFTGSVEITGSLSLNGFSVITSDQTGSMSVLSASYASTASYAISASFTQNSISASYVSGSAAIITNLTSSNDARINGVTAGRGAGAEWTVFGQEAANRSSNGYGVAIGYRALYSSTNTGNVAVGRLAARDTTTGRDNVAIGSNALLANTTGQQNTAIGGIALSNINGSYNTAVGNGSFNGVTAGSYNTVVGWLFSTGITTANYNTIIGAGITGLPSVLSNNIILADGQGNIKYRWDAVQNNIYGKLVVTGSVTATQGFTGSLFGTASWALNFVTESVTSASYAYTASSAVSSSYAYTASSAVSSSYSYTASSAVNANSALTASSADDFVVRQSITASNALINGTITAQTLVVQTISSSVIYSSGSNIFGDELTDKQTFTGSVEITGSLSLNGFSVITSDQTGSMSVLSASYASTASYAENAISASYVSGSAAIVTNLTSSNDANINGLTVGRGKGTTANSRESTAVGYEVLLNNTSGYNTAFGYKALSASTTAFANTAIGLGVLQRNSTGGSNTGVGSGALLYNTGTGNTAIGRGSLINSTTGNYNLAIGVQSGFNLSSGQYNIFIGGWNSGFSITTGNYNTILGSQLTSLPADLSNNIILADGQGNIKYRWDVTQTNIYGNLVITGSTTSTLGFTGSLFGTASWAQNFITGSVTSASYAYTASSAVSSSYALTASSADNFVVRQDITASNALINGTIMAQTLVVQTVSSSVVYSSGSNVFGNNLSNTQVFTGSVSVTGSLEVNGSNVILTNQTSSMSVLSASYAYTASSAVSSSYAYNADFLDGKDSTVFATTGSNTFIGDQTVTGSLSTSGSNTLVGITTLTGSFNVSGSTFQVGNNTLFGNTLLSGSIVISGSHLVNTPSIKIYGDVETDGAFKFLPVSYDIDPSISGSYIYVSGSTNDLYFSQNGNGYANTTRLRWLEGNLYSGLLNGGLITTQSSTVYQISSGSGIIVDLNASINDNPYPIVNYLNWNNLSASIAPLSASYDQSFVAVLSNGTIGAQGTPYQDGDYNTKIPIGIVIHQNRSTINAVQTFPNVAYGWKQRSSDFIRAFGPLKINGYTLAPSGSSTRGLVLSGGTAWVDGRNYIVDPNNPSYITEGTGIVTSKIYRYRQSGSDWAYDTNAGAGYTDIDPTQYSNNGVLTPVPVTNWTIQRVYYFPNSATKALYVYYGNATYANESLALAAVNTETFVEAPNTAANAIYVGFMLLRNNADFTVSSTYDIYEAGLFRASGVGGGAGGGGGATSLASLSDVSLSSPTDYQALVYNLVTTKWENRSFISASISGNAATATSASYASTASFLIGYNPYQIATGSVTASVDTNADSIFLIKSGSVSFLNISSSGDTTLSSDLFIVKNLTSQQPVLTVSQSVVKIATHSFDPNGTIEAGSIWFTSTAMYVGLE